MSAIAITASAIAVTASAFFLVPAVVDLASLMRVKRTRPASSGRRSSFLFLIPAHDEASQIVGCVRSVADMTYPEQLVRIVVVADNCSDDTAARAVAAGAECLVRQDAARRGKPYAIAWALERLAGGSHDAVVILDADAVVDARYAAALDAASPLRNKAIECYDDVRNPGDSPLTRMAKVLSAGRFRGAFALKQATGLTVPLSDGMCLGVDLLKRHPWRAFGISEDWELYAQLTAAGERIELVSSARLYAQEAGTLRQSHSQRHRWLAGKLDALRRVGPDLIAARDISLRQKLDTLCELAVPGPAVQLGVTGACAVMVGLAVPSPAPLLALLAISLARPIVYAAIGLAVVPDRLRTIAAFTYLPIYTCWRLTVALASVWPARQRAWVRTARV